MGGIIDKIKNWFKRKMPGKCIEKYFIVDEYRCDKDVLDFLQRHTSNNVTNKISTEVHFCSAKKDDICGYVELWKGETMLDKALLQKGANGLVYWKFDNQK